VRTIQYKTADGAVIGNTEKETAMDKKTLVDALIANSNSPFEEGDREFLMGKSVDVLQKLSAKPVANQLTAPKDLTEAEQAKWDKMTEEERAAFLESRKAPAKKEATKEPPVAMSAEQFISTAPPAYREMLIEGLQAHNTQKQSLISTITANKANVFSAEQLAEKSLQELRAIAALAAKPSTNFAGLGDGVGVTNSKAEEPLVAPAMDFSK
jgi:hypothetical protein